MRAALGQMAFEQGKFIYGERRTGETGMMGDEAFRIAAAPSEARQGYMGQVGAFFCREACCDADAVNLPVKVLESIVRLDACP